MTFPAEFEIRGVRVWISFIGNEPTSEGTVRVREGGIRLPSLLSSILLNRVIVFLGLFIYEFMLSLRACPLYEAFHVNCPSARRASPKSCYF